MATSWPWTGIYGSVRTRSVLTYRDVETGGAAVPSIERRVRGGELRWYARFRDPAGAKKVKVFNRRVDAERFLTTVEASKLTGSYIDPKRAAITFGAFAQEHRAAYSHTSPPTQPGCVSVQCSIGTSCQRWESPNRHDQAEHRRCRARHVVADSGTGNGRPNPPPSASNPRRGTRRRPGREQVRDGRGRATPARSPPDR
jgi:hypothetical protein